MSIATNPKQDNNLDVNAEPSVKIAHQYLKDLSFETQDIYKLIGVKEVPSIDLSLDLNVTSFENNNFEVEIVFHANAKFKEQTAFILEMKYAGLFTLSNVPEDQIKAVLAVYCPTLLFPYARNIVSEVTRNAGFQPLMIDPIDFAALYQSKMQSNPQES